MSSAQFSTSAHHVNSSSSDNKQTTWEGKKGCGLLHHFPENQRQKRRTAGVQLGGRSANAPKTARQDPIIRRWGCYCWRDWHPVASLTSPNQAACFYRMELNNLLSVAAAAVCAELKVNLFPLLCWKSLLSRTNPISAYQRHSCWPDSLISIKLSFS